MRHIILTGDSHLGPLKRGMMLDRGIEAATVTFWPLGKGAGARQAFFDVGAEGVTTHFRSWHNRTYTPDAMAEISPDAVLVVSLPMNTSRILRDYSWHSHAPWRLAKEEIALSDAVVSALIEQDSQYAVEFVLALKKIWPRTAVIEAPRFFRNASYLESQRFEVCRYVDQLYRAQVGDRLGAAGVDVIAQPRETITVDGATDLAYDHENPDDDHHGNAHYGLAALRAVLAYAAAV